MPESHRWIALCDPDGPSGIRVVSLDRESSIGERLFITLGTQSTDELESLVAQYERGSRVPTGNWNLASSTHYVRSSWVKGRSIGLARIDPSVVEPIINALAGAKKDRAGLRNDLAGPLNAVVSHLSSRFSIEEAAFVHGLAHHPTGLPTVTRNHRSGKFIGLHIDSWDQLAFPRRNEARPRISVNLGLTSRFLIFLPIAAGTVWNACISAGLPVQGCQPTPIGRLFMAHWREHPVLKLEVPPGLQSAIQR